MTRRFLVLAIAAAVVLAGVVSFVDNQLVTHHSGPIRFGFPDGGNEVGMQVAVGETVGFSGSTVVNEGSTPLVLRSVVLSGDAGGNDMSTMLGVYLHAYAPGKPYVGRWPADYQWSSTSLLPIDGYKLDPGAKVELLILVRPNRDGEHLWPGTELRYERNGRRYLATDRFAFRICAPEDSSCGDTEHP